MPSLIEAGLLTFTVYKEWADILTSRGSKIDYFNKCFEPNANAHVTSML